MCSKDVPAYLAPITLFNLVPHIVYKSTLHEFSRSIRLYTYTNENTHNISNG